MACMLRCCHSCCCLWHCVTLPSFFPLTDILFNTGCIHLLFYVFSLHSYKTGCSHLPSQTVAMPAVRIRPGADRDFFYFLSWVKIHVSYLMHMDLLLLSWCPFVVSLSLRLYHNSLLVVPALPLFRADRHPVQLTLVQPSLDVLYIAT